MRRFLDGRIALLVVALQFYGCEPYDAWQTAPLASLLVAPSDYQGEAVAVRGYTRSQRGRMFLFLTSEHAQVGDLSNSVLLYRTLDGGEAMEDLAPCDQSFSLVFGTFDELPNELVGITDIERVVRYTPEGDADDDCFSANEADNRSPR